MPIDFATDYGNKYTLTGPDGTIAVFNDTTDPNFVGMLTNISGLDSPEMHESGEDLVEFDGGTAGPGFFGRRPVVLEGITFGHSTSAQRAARLMRLRKASEAMSRDATLTWTPNVTGGVPVVLYLRRQQPYRESGGWNKTFQVSMIAADPRIYSATTNSASVDPSTGPLLVTNNGSSIAYPQIVLAGAITDPTITLSSNYDPLTAYGTNGSISTSALSLAAATNLLLVSPFTKQAFTSDRKTTTRTNLATDPSFEGATTNGWVGGTAHTVASVTSASAAYGGRVLRVTRSAGTPATAITKTITGLTGGATTVMLFSFSYRNAVAGQLGRYAVTWVAKNGGGTIIAGVTTPSYGNQPYYFVQDTWRRLSVPAFLPMIVGTASLEITINYLPLNHTVAATDLQIDGVVLEQFSTYSTPNGSPYFDGATAMTDYTTAWSGTANASTSVATLANLGATDFFNYAPAFSKVQSYSTWGGLAPGLNAISVTGATGTGSYLRAEWRDTWL